MSRTLNLADHLLAQGRHYQALGLTHQAIGSLKRLAGLNDLPAPVAEETHQRLGQMHLDRCQHAKARRHLAAALTHQPNNPHSHFLMAGALEGDAKGDTQHALAHYRQALEIYPDHPGYLSAYGLLAIAEGEQEDGLRSLRRAVELAGDNIQVVQRAAEGFRLADLAEEARTTLRLALFRNPRDGRFRQLWQDQQFQEAWTEQQQAGGPRDASADDEPVILPFLRVINKKSNVRRDAASRTPGPHTKNPAQTRRKRQA